MIDDRFVSFFGAGQTRGELLDLPSGILPFLALIFRLRLSNRSIKASKQEFDEKKKKGGRKGKRRKDN